LTAATIAVSLVGAVTAWRRPQLSTSVALAVGVTAGLQVGMIDWSTVVALCCAAAVALVDRRNLAVRLAGGAELMAAAWIALRIANVSANGLVGGMLAAAITLTGLAFTTRRLTELDGAAWAATLLAGVSLQIADPHPVYVSLVLLVASAQGVVYGLAKQRRELVTGSTAAGVVALISLWFTSGTNAALLRGLARFDFTATDLTVLMISVLLLGAGAVARRWQPMSTWLAFGPGLGLLAAWVIPVQLERHADWATMVGLAVGITALGIGGLRKLAAPLVIGTGLTGATVVIASGSQLSSLPGWTWLVVGGAGLLGLAALVERRSKTEAGLTGGVKEMLEQFR
jgi:hypothetical protein